MALIGVVEDNGALAEVYTAAFTLAGYSVRTYGRGAALLEAFFSGAACDIYIVDLGLPDIPGMEVIATLCQTMTTPRLPIIAVSASCDELVRVSVHFPGISTFQKPFPLEDIVQRVAHFEQQFRQLSSIL